jgi:hypothetical protein
VSGKRYREPPVPRKARSGRGPDAPNIKLYIFKPKAVEIKRKIWVKLRLPEQKFAGFVVFKLRIAGQKAALHFFPAMIR